MGTLHRLVTNRERVSRDAGQVVREAIMALPEASVSAFERVLMLKALGRVTAPEAAATVWPGGFSMISLQQIGRVWAAIDALPSKHRPKDVRRVFDLVLLNLVPDEGRVNLSRSEFAERAGIGLEDASRALGVLVKLEVLERRLVRVDGMRGPGIAVFYINPNVAWNGALDVRMAEARKRNPPLLKLMEGAARE